MTDTYLYEFLYRGNADTSPDDDTYQVILRRDGVGLQGEPKSETTAALTPSMAADLGFPLTRILRDINVRAIVQAERAAENREKLDRLSVEYTDLELRLQSAVEEGKARLAEAERASEASGQAARAEVAAAAAESSEMRAKLVTAMGRSETAVASMRQRMEEAKRVADSATSDADKYRAELNSLQAAAQTEIDAAKNAAADKEKLADERVREADRVITTANEAIFSEQRVREQLVLVEQRLREAEAEVAETAARADNEMVEANAKVIAADAKTENWKNLAEAAVKSVERENERIARERETLASLADGVESKRREADARMTTAEIAIADAAKSVASAQSSARETAAQAADDVAAMVKLSPEGRARFVARLLSPGGAP